MWQGAERQIDIGKIDFVDLYQIRQVQIAQVRKYIAVGHAGLAFPRQGNDFHIGVAGNQAHQFSAGIAAGTKDRDFMGHG